MNKIKPNFYSLLQVYFLNENIALYQYILLYYIFIKLKGAFKVPAGGFEKFKVKISKSYISSHSRLPVAHTCFNQLELPVYSSKNEFKSNLEKALQEGNTGFFIS